MLTVNQNNENGQEVEKIMKILNCLEGSVITILSSKTEVPKYFKNLEKIENENEILNIYKKNYTKIS